MKQAFSILILAMLFLILDTSSVIAATVSLDPATGSYGPGETFVVTVRLDLSIDECVNAATIELVYPKNLMKASVVSKGESVLTLWPSEPAVDVERGVVSFSGGVPAGYCGRIQGDPGKTNILAKVIFSIQGDAVGGEVASPRTLMPITFGSGTQVLENDGQGSPAELSVKSGIYKRLPLPSGAKNEWLEIVRADTVPPDVFTATLQQDGKMFQGNHYIIFLAIDKQSGVHHYEVSEDDLSSFGMVRGKPSVKAPVVTVTSPYVLTDQTLESRIIVRAIDHSGNVQETIIAPTNGADVLVGRTKEEQQVRFWYMLLIIGAALIFGAIISVIVYRRMSPRGGTQ